MRRITLLYNPVSGRDSEARLDLIETVASVLRDREADVDLLATEAPGTGGAQAAEACDRGADIVFACGGDGTIHEVLQGMVFQEHSALGVLPLGSANALARHLQLSLDPVRAALQQLDRMPQLVPAGHITYQTSEGERSRYFTVMAGAGPDGALVYRMLAEGKQRLGRSTYYMRAAQLFLRSRFAPFSVTCDVARTAPEASFQAVSAMAVRVGSLGGLFHPLIRGASLEHADLLLTAATHPAWLSLPAWFAMGWTGLRRWTPHVRSLRVEGFHCGAGEEGAVQVQADGEWLGRTPMTVRLVPAALRLLLP